MLTAHDNHPYLSGRDVDRLENYKRRYSLESAGFSTTEAHRLIFASYLLERGKLNEGTPALRHEQETWS